MYLSPLLAGSRVRYYSTRIQTVQYASRPTNTPYFTPYESAQRARRTFMNVSIAPLATSRYDVPRKVLWFIEALVSTKNKIIPMFQGVILARNDSRR